MSTPPPESVVHDALRAMLDEDELAISWVLTIDVAGPDGTRYLAHRAGGGADGTDKPMVWTALGMLEASVELAREQLLDATVDSDDDEDAPEGDEG